MVIRDGELSDIPRLTRLVKHLWRASNYVDFTEFDRATVVATLESMMAQPYAVVKVASLEGRVMGLGAAIAFPYHWNAHHTTAQEFFWWVEPEAKGQGVGKELIRHMELWAKRIGAKTFVMSHQAKHDIGPMFEYMGYSAIENSFMREL